MWYNKKQKGDALSDRVNGFGEGEHKMKFLHTGDLHLDSPFAAQGALDADARRAEQRALLRRIFQCAQDEACDMMLIAGDLFDGKYVTPETRETVLQLFKAFGKPIVIAPGNHDPYTTGSFWQTVDLPNVWVFSSSEVQCFVFESLKTKVYGYAFLSAAMRDNPLAEQNGEEDGLVHLLCAHGDLHQPLSPYAPLMASDMVRMGIDYAALGHIHNLPKPLKEEHTEIRYCGFAEGRSFDECGDGGVWIVTAEPGEAPICRRHVLSRVRYCCEELDLGHVADEAELKSRLREVVQRQGEQATHLRLTLTGSVPGGWLAPMLADLPSWQGELCSLTVQDLTVPLEDGQALEKDVSLKGAFYRSLRERLLSEDPKERRRALRALQIGLCAIEGRRIPTEEDDQ